MRMGKRGLAALSVGAAVQALLASAASAQGANDDSLLKEIVVTATRREESLSKVPISISAFTQESLDERNVRSIDDIARLTPGVQFDRTSNSTGGLATISIRGISSPDAGSGATGIYIDDTPIQARASVGGIGSSAFPQIFDLERVEILRGPQGTLFGAGSEGGTLRFITPQPSTTKYSNYTRGDVSFTTGGSPNFEAGTAFNFPLVENRVGLRVSAAYRRDGGYMDHIDIHSLQQLDKDSNWGDSKSVRAALAFQATDNLLITPSLHYQEEYSNNSNVFWKDYTDPVTGRKTVYSRPEKGEFGRGLVLTNSAQDHFVLPALKVDWDLGSMRLISNTSYYDRSQDGINDLGSFEAAMWAGNPIYPAGLYAPSHEGTFQKTITQEIRLQSQGESRINWVAGAFYQRAKQGHFERVQNTFLPQLFFDNTGLNFNDIFPGGLYEGLYTVKIDPVNTVDKQLALFGQLDYKITDKLTATAGLRYAKTDFGIHVRYAGPIVGPPAEDRGTKSAKPVTPKFGLSYQATDDTMIYASAAKGFRSGGYNNPVALSCGVSQNGRLVPGTSLGDMGLLNRPALFDDDTVWSYELGTKMRGLDGRLQVDASIYQIKWDGIQFGYSLPSCGFSFTTNAGSAISRGFELAVQAQPVDAWTLGLAIGHVKAEYQKTVVGPAGAVIAPPAGTLAIISEGDQVTVAPWTVSLTSQWQFNVLDRDAYFRLSYDHRAAIDDNLPWHNANNGNYDPLVPGPEANKDLSLRLGMKVGGTDIALFANNATNEHPSLGRRHWTRSSTLWMDVTKRPRTVGLTATHRF